MSSHRNKEGYDYLFKIVVVGNSGVGKSSLMNRFVDNKFSDRYVSTLGVDFKIKTLKYFDKKCKLTIWDTAGQERFMSLTSKYYRGADGVILVYDINDASTFNNLDYWMKEVDDNNSVDPRSFLTKDQIRSQELKAKYSSNAGANYSSQGKLAKLCVGNKLDLAPKKRKVETQVAQDYARRYEMELVEASAKKNENVHLAFQRLLVNMIENSDLKDIKPRKYSTVELGKGKELAIPGGSDSKTCGCG